MFWFVFLRNLPSSHAAGFQPNNKSAVSFNPAILLINTPQAGLFVPLAVKTHSLIGINPVKYSSS